MKIYQWSSFIFYNLRLLYFHGDHLDSFPTNDFSWIHLEVKQSDPLDPLAAMGIYQINLYANRFIDIPTFLFFIACL